jgi:hypothetical protein
MAHQSTEIKPFDEGYDYEADDSIDVRALRYADSGLSLYKASALLREAAGEIRALRLLILNQTRTIHDLTCMVNEIKGEDEQWTPSSPS